MSGSSISTLADDSSDFLNLMEAAYGSSIKIRHTTGDSQAGSNIKRHKTDHVRQVRRGQQNTIGMATEIVPEPRKQRNFVTDYERRFILIRP